MNVNELIEELKKYPGDIHVLVRNPVDDLLAASISEQHIAYIDRDNTYYDDSDYNAACEGVREFITNPDEWERIKAITIW